MSDCIELSQYLIASTSRAEMSGCLVLHVCSFGDIICNNTCMKARMTVMRSDR
jgi:hypothetical protein